MSETEQAQPQQDQKKLKTNSEQSVNGTDNKKNRDNATNKVLQTQIRELDKSLTEHEKSNQREREDKIPLIELDDRQEDWDDDDGAMFEDETDENEREHQHEQEHDEHR